VELSPWLKSLMGISDQPSPPGEKFRIRPNGKWHTAGHIDCPGCDAMDGIRYPHPHQDKAINHLEFLVHGEAIGTVFVRFCEGSCPIPPIQLAPPPAPKESI
jgi:hypothetical protein